MAALATAGDGAMASESYVIVEATTENVARSPPTWIAVKSSRPPNKFTHIPADAGIVPLKPGHYRILHIDFAKNSNSGLGTLYIRRARSIEFDVLPNSITFVGRLIGRRIAALGSGERDFVEVIRDGALVRKACTVNSGAMARLPIYVAGSKARSSADLNQELKGGFT